MCDMWSPADQYNSESESVYKQIKISKSLNTTHSALSVNPSRYFWNIPVKLCKSQAVVYPICCQSSRYFFSSLRRNNSGVSVLFWFYLVLDRKKYCDAWSISLNMASQVWLRSILTSLSYYAKLYICTYKIRNSNLIHNL